MSVDQIIDIIFSHEEDVATAAQLNTEIQNRISADDALGLRIDNETTARENADTALQGQITSNKNGADHMFIVMSEISGSPRSLDPKVLYGTTVG